MSSPASGVLEAPAQEFYRHALDLLRDADVPFLVGGAYAFAQYAGVVRHTKDLDLFLRGADVPAARAAFEAEGYRTELTYEYWLAKAFHDDHFVDLIFNLGNGAGPVEDDWLTHAGDGELLGVPVKLVGPADMVWAKVFVMDRGRYDGADVAHLLRAWGDRLDWPRLLARFGEHWRVLLHHLVMFGYVYPTERDKVPGWVMRDLIARLADETAAPAAGPPVCRGTLLSPTQYLTDVEEWGYKDARLPPFGGLTPEQIERWTDGVLAGR